MDFLLRRALPSLLALGLLLQALPLGSAQDQIFLEFKFKDLRFKVWPAGLENKGSADGKGSAITVHVNDVRIEDEAAVELRYCIDDPSYCGNDATADGIVKTSEVQSFENLTKLGIRSQVKRVDQLLDALKTNITVDGKMGKSSLIFNAHYSGAEGPVDSASQILATIEAKVTYENDPKAARHSIHVGNLSLSQDGFTYENALWTAAIPGWRFDAAATTPADAQTKVNKEGYFSNQAQFEALSDKGFEMGIVKDAAGKRKSPGFDAALIVLALPLAILAWRHRP